MYRSGSEIVAEIRYRIDEMGARWQKKTIDGAGKWKEWYEVFKSAVEPFIATKAGQKLSDEDMKQLIDKIKEARKQYAEKRRSRR